MGVVELVVVLVDVVVVVFGTDVVVGGVVVGLMVGLIVDVVVVGFGATDVAAASVFGSAEPPQDDNVSAVTSTQAAIAPNARDGLCRPPDGLGIIACIMTSNHRRLRSLA